MDEISDQLWSRLSQWSASKGEEKTDQLRGLLGAILIRLEALEAQKETPCEHHWLVAPGLPTQCGKCGALWTETPPSSPATAVQEAAQSGNSTSSKMFYLVKEDHPGQWLLMGTVTLAELNSLPDRGKALKDWQDLGWILLTPSMWEWQWRSGATPSPTLGVQGDGQYVGTSGDGNAYRPVEEQP